MNSATNPNRSSLGLGWINVLIGTWLVVSPFELRFAHNTAGISNNISVGIALVILTFGSMRMGPLKGLIVLMGAWLYASAFILGVPQKLFLWNNLILAFLVIIAALSSEGPYAPNFRRQNQLRQRHHQ